MEEKEKKPAKTMTDANGNVVPVAYVKPYDKMRDKVARRVLARFMKANKYLAQVKADTLSDIEFLRNFEDPSGKKIGGVKGNVQFCSFDGLVRVRLDARTTVEFDDRFNRAQDLIFDYLKDLTSDTKDQDIATIIRAAFQPSSSGFMSKGKIVGLFRLKIEKPKWQEAMKLLRECQFVKSGKTYVSCDVKPSSEADFENIPLDIAAIDPAE